MKDVNKPQPVTPVTERAVVPPAEKFARLKILVSKIVHIRKK